MIEILDMQEENTLGFRVDGEMGKDELQNVFELFEKKVEKNGKVKFYTEITNFGINDLTADAVKADIKFWLTHPTILPNFEKVALVTDLSWVKKIFEVECALIPTLIGKSFPLTEKDEALEWLKTDQREAGRLDITYTEMVETSTIKFSSGFALGLLTAGLLSKKQRNTIGTAVLCGAVLAGIPLGLKVLNNNRQLLKK